MSDDVSYSSHVIRRTSDDVSCVSRVVRRSSHVMERSSGFLRHMSCDVSRASDIVGHSSHVVDRTSRVVRRMEDFIGHTGNFTGNWWKSGERRSSASHLHGRLPRFQDSKRLRNSAHAFVTSGALRMAETTQMRFAPAARTASIVCKFTPPMANHGTVACAAAQRA